MSIRRQNDLLQSSSDLLVLSVLADQPLYGYAISKQVAAQSNGAIRLTAGALYPLLHEMEQHGLLLSSWDLVRAADNQDETRGRRRKWYRLSAKGRRRLAQRIEAHRTFQSIIESFLPSPHGAAGSDEGSGA